MTIVHTNRIEIIECVHVRGRGSSTLVSIDADGKRHFTISLGGIRNLTSGGPTVINYLGSETKVVHAWLDPVTGEYFVANAHAPTAAFWVAIMSALIAVAIVISLGFSSTLIGLIMLVLAVGSGAALVRQAIWNRRLESRLRAALAS